MSNLYSDKDITFVIQGIPIETTEALCVAIKQFFPLSKTIYSGPNIEATQVAFKCDSIDSFVLHKQIEDTPGPAIQKNLNRNILSIKNALMMIDTALVVKFRSDAKLASNQILEYWNQSFKIKKGSFLQHKLIVNDLCTRISRYYPLHVSDWFYFGFADDLWELFNIGFKTDDARTPAESFITASLVERYEHRRYDEILLENFIVLELEKYGIIPSKYDRNKQEDRQYLSLDQAPCWSEELWHARYKDLIAFKTFQAQQ